MEAVEANRVEATPLVWGDLKSGVRFRAGLGRRIRLWIENGDWDERIIKAEGKIDLVCWAALLAFIIFLIPGFLKAWM